MAIVMDRHNCGGLWIPWGEEKHYQELPSHVRVCSSCGQIENLGAGCSVCGLDRDWQDGSRSCIRLRRRAARAAGVVVPPEASFMPARRSKRSPDQDKRVRAQRAQARRAS